MHIEKYSYGNPDIYWKRICARLTNAWAWTNGLAELAFWYTGTHQHSPCMPCITTVPFLMWWVRGEILMTVWWFWCLNCGFASDRSHESLWHSPFATGLVSAFHSRSQICSVYRVPCYRMSSSRSSSQTPGKLGHPMCTNLYGCTTCELKNIVLYSVRKRPQIGA